MVKRKLPHFKNEAEEAQWWYDHRDEVAQDLIDAIRSGTSGPGALRRLELKRMAAQEQQEQENPLQKAS